MENTLRGSVCKPSSLNGIRLLLLIVTNNDTADVELPDRTDQREPEKTMKTTQNRVILTLMKLNVAPCESKMIQSSYGVKMRNQWIVFIAIVVNYTCFFSSFFIHI